MIAAKPTYLVVLHKKHRHVDAEGGVDDGSRRLPFHLDDWVLIGSMTFSAHMECYADSSEESLKSERYSCTKCERFDVFGWLSAKDESFLDEDKTKHHF